MKKNLLVFAFAAFFSFFVVNAQAQSEFHSLFNYNADDAIEYIGGLAHPMQDVLDTEITRSTSSYIDIRIKFSSLMRNYWEPYRINLKQYHGYTYAYSIVRTNAVSIYEPFIALDFFTRAVRGFAAGMGFTRGDDDEAIHALYGVWPSELSKEQKAAIMLMSYLYDD